MSMLPDRSRGAICQMNRDRIGSWTNSITLRRNYGKFNGARSSTDSKRRRPGRVYRPFALNSDSACNEKDSKRAAHGHERDCGRALRGDSPHLTVQRENVRISNIIFINALIYIAENGCNPRALPMSFGK